MRGKACVMAVLIAVGLGACASEPNRDGTPPASTEPSAPQGVPDIEADSRVVAPAGQAEYNQALLACMEARGWSGTATADSTSFSYPADQFGQFQQDNDECAAEALPLLPTPEPLTDELLRLNYERTVAAYNCYLTNGFEPEQPLPSFQRWRDRLEAGQDYDVASVELDETTRTGGSLDAIDAVCPNPITFFFDAATRIYPDDVDYDAYSPGG